MSDVTANETAGKSVFLSYSRTDRSLVLPIIAALERAGHSVWWDGLLEGGDRFSKITENALETADVVLVAWTKESVESDWVRDEATHGRDAGKMLSVSLDGTMPPLGFRQIQYIDLSGAGSPETRPAFGDVLAVLAKGANDGEFSPRPSALPDSSGGVSRRNLLIAGTAGALILGSGLAAWRGGWLTESSDSTGIAILTFRNLSNDPEQEYFSAGLSEELRTILSLNPQLAVAAQTSSDKFRDTSETASAIATALGVGHVLEGSVRMAGNQIRVGVRLIDGATDLDVWSDVFEEELDDILDVQSEIATAVADSLIASFSSESGDALVRVGGTDNPKALDAFLRGADLYAQASATEDNDRAALAFFEQAVDIDPDFASAHAARARSLTTIGNRHASGKELRSYYDRAMEAARTAIEKAPDLAEGHAALGGVLANGNLDIAAATGHYERCFDLGYGNADILSGYTLFASYVGEFETGRDAIARAQRLDPLNATIFRAAAVLEFAARNYEAAATAARRTLALNEKTSIANRILGDIAGIGGRLDEAREFYNAEPSTLSRLPSLAILEKRAGNTSAAQDAFDAMLDQFGDNSLYQQAQVFAQWGQGATAMETLERAFQAGDAGLVLSHTDQKLDPIRQTAEFEALQRRLGFAA